MTTEQLLREALVALQHHEAQTRPIELTSNVIFAIQEHLSAPAQPASGEAVTPERVAWAPYLVDRADGVRGHYAIGRWNPRGYREVWNLHTHRWAAYSDDVMSLEEADSLLRQIVIPTVRTTPPASQERVASELERIAYEAPVSGNLIAQERVLMAAARIRGGQPASQEPKHCPSCGTHEVALALTCHNAGCGSYAAPVTVYEGWKQQASQEQAQPAARVAMTDEQVEQLAEDLAEWSRHVVEDTAHTTLFAHVNGVLRKHGIGGISGNGATDPTTP